MYRFNGFDGRLDRMLEAAVLVRSRPVAYRKTRATCPAHCAHRARTHTTHVPCQVMESFTGFENRFKFSIGGTNTHTHTRPPPMIALYKGVWAPLQDTAGTAPTFRWSTPSSSPRTAASAWPSSDAWPHTPSFARTWRTRPRTHARTKTLPTPKTRTRSGDYTLTATELAIRELEKEEADEHFVIVVSDANLRRYGISPRTVRSHPWLIPPPPSPVCAFLLLARGV